MGFGTSGSMLIVFAALFIAVSTLYTVSTNTTERLRSAQQSQTEHQQTIRSTQIAVVDATWNTTSSNLTLRVNNTGETTLSVRQVDVVVDGTYLDSSDFERAEVDGRSTDVWRPGEQLVLEDADSLTGLSEAPSRVKFVTGPGVAGVAPVEVRS